MLPLALTVPLIAHIVNVAEPDKVVDSKPPWQFV
jgi:hypothetical protein